MSSSPYLLFIESNSTGSGVQALSKARELGLVPVLFARNPELYTGIQASGCLTVACETNILATLRATITDFLEAKPGEMCGITTTSEFYLETVATLTAQFGLPGNAVPLIQACRHKDRTRQLLSSCGLLQPRFAVIEHVDEVPRVLASVGLPCVVKPTDDTGSYGVRFCDSVEVATDHVSHLLGLRRNVRGQPTAGRVLCEEYIEAPEYSVETFAWQGQIVCIGVTQKRLTGFPYFVEVGHTFPAVLSPADRATIEATTLLALRLVGNVHGPMHTEVKLTPDGCVVVEINARLAGGMIPELVWQARGIDLLTSHLLSTCGRPPRLIAAWERYAGIHFITADRVGRLVAVEGLSEVRRKQNVSQAVCAKSRGQEVRPPQNAYDRVGYVIMCTEQFADLNAGLNQLRDELTVVVDAPA